MNIRKFLPYTPLISTGWSIYTLMNQNGNLKTNTVARSAFSNYDWFPKNEKKANQRVNQIRACSAFIPILGNLIVGSLDLFCYLKSKKSPVLPPPQLSKSNSSISESPPLRCNFPRNEDKVALAIEACKEHEVTDSMELQKIVKAIQPRDKELIDFMIFYKPGMIHIHSNQGVSYTNFEEMRQGYKWIYATLYKENDKIYIKLSEVYISFLSECKAYNADEIREQIYFALDK